VEQGFSVKYMIMRVVSFFEKQFLLFVHTEAIA